MKVDIYPFGDVEIVGDLAKVPDGDFGRCEYEGSLVGEEWDGDQYEGRDIYSSVHRGQCNYYMV